MTKQELRRLIRERKALCPIEERAKLSEALCQKVQQHPRWKEARTVLLYHALPDEVDTSLLLRTKVENNQPAIHTDDKPLPIAERYGGGGGEGLLILLPVVVGDDLELRIFDGTTSEGAFHIQEPTGELFTDYASIDLAIIPGMAFDPDGHRLGRGKGYYDRLLPRLPRAYRLGLCFPFQLLDTVPAEEHDIKMDEVVSTQP